VGRNEILSSCMVGIDLLVRTARSAELFTAFVAQV
jgi:hypothetical protein